MTGYRIKSGMTGLRCLVAAVIIRNWEYCHKKMKKNNDAEEGQGSDTLKKIESEHEMK